MNQQKAFTLIELLIVLSIFFIFLGISLPNLSELFSENQSMILQKQLIQAIQFAREQTMLRDSEVGLKIDNNKLIIFLDENHSGVINKTSQILRIVQINLQNNTLFWRSYPYYRDYLLFASGADFRSDNGTFWYCRNGQKNPLWAIMLGSSAQIRMSDNKPLINCNSIKNK